MANNNIFLSVNHVTIRLASYASAIFGVAKRCPFAARRQTTYCEALGGNAGCETRKRLSFYLRFLIGLLLFWNASTGASPPPNYWEDGALIFIGTPIQREEVWLEHQDRYFRTFFSVEEVLKGQIPNQKLALKPSSSGKIITVRGIYVDCFRSATMTGSHYFDQLPLLGEKRIFIFAKSRTDIPVTSKYTTYVDYDLKDLEIARRMIAGLKERSISKPPNLTLQCFSGSPEIVDVRGVRVRPHKGMLLSDHLHIRTDSTALVQIGIGAASGSLVIRTNSSLAIDRVRGFLKSKINFEIQNGTVCGDLDACKFSPQLHFSSKEAHLLLKPDSHTLFVIRAGECITINAGCPQQILTPKRHMLSLEDESYDYATDKLIEIPEKDELLLHEISLEEIP